MIGEIAHIRGEQPGSARYDGALSAQQRSGYQNLIFLCPTCHDKVDQQSLTFTVDRLVELKRFHEQWVRESLDHHMPTVGFVELENVCAAIVSGSTPPPETLQLTYPTRKLVRNGLTDTSKEWFDLGFWKSPEVQRFVQSNAVVDASFPDRLRAGFLATHAHYTSLGLSGDDLFEALMQFAGGGSADIRRQAAGLAVLAYLFQVCDLFDP